MADGMAAVLEQYFVDARRADAAGGNAAPASSGASVGMSAEEFHTKLTVGSRVRGRRVVRLRPLAASCS
jgi:hypothetical protein